jgi:tetratricopeptide (TPR) repeat protein
LSLAVGRQSRYLEAERLEAARRDADAVRVLERIVGEDPGERSFVALGIALAKMGDYAGAEKALRQALRHNPAKVQAHYFLGVVLYEQAEALRKQGGDASRGRRLYEEAAASCREAGKLKPDHAFAHVYRGLALQRLDRHALALESLRRGVSCQPNYSDTHLRLGEVLAEQGQKAEALIHLRRAVRLAGEGDPGPRRALQRLQDERKK